MERFAAAVGTLARDAQFEHVAELVRDARHRHYLFWVVSYMKDPRAVNVCLGLLDDNELGMSALRSLADLKSERARAVLAHVADVPTKRGRSDEPQLQRHRAQIARKGAREAGPRSRVRQDQAVTGACRARSLAALRDSGTCTAGNRKSSRLRVREIDPGTGSLMGLEYWHASRVLPEALLSMLPPPQVAVDI